ncbi:MAG TPA: hypothetical protein VGE01_07515 [Fimbriimonas sp.]
MFALGGLILVLAVGVGSCANSDLFRASRGLDGQLRKARAEGLIVDLREYQPPKVADSNNAGPAYRQALQEVQGVRKEAFQTIQRLRKGSLSPEQERELRQALTEVQPTLQAVVRAAAKPGLDFQRNWADGMHLQFPEYGGLHLIGDALRLDALRRLRSNDVDGALREASALAALGRHIGQEPVIMAAIVQGGTTDQAFEVLAEAIRIHGRDAKVREQIRKAVAQMGPPPDPRHSAKLELAWQLQAIDGMGSNSPGVIGEESIPIEQRLGKLGIVRRAYKARIVEYWRAFHAALPKDPTHYLEAFRAVRELDAEYDSAHGHEGHDHQQRSGLSYAMVLTMRPVFSGATTVMARAEAEKRLLLAGVDVLDGKGSLPADPFSEGPLLRKGNLIYSVAENQKDDGGSREHGKGMGLPLDFVLALPN